jgi:hypothetical protein
MQFGFLRTNSSDPFSSAATTLGGIDNWKLTVHTVPEPSALLLSAFGLVVLSSVRARLKNPAGS